MEADVVYEEVYNGFLLSESINDDDDDGGGGSLNDDDSPVDRLFLSDTELEEIKDNHQYINLQYLKDELIRLEKLRLDDEYSQQSYNNNDSNNHNYHHYTATTTRATTASTATTIQIKIIKIKAEIERLEKLQQEMMEKADEEFLLLNNCKSRSSLTTNNHLVNKSPSSRSFNNEDNDSIIIDNIELGNYNFNFIMIDAEIDEMEHNHLHISLQLYQDELSRLEIQHQYHQQLQYQYHQNHQYQQQEQESHCSIIQKGIDNMSPIEFVRQEILCLEQIRQEIQYRRLISEQNYDCYYHHHSILNRSTIKQQENISTLSCKDDHDHDDNEDLMTMRMNNKNSYVEQVSAALTPSWDINHDNNDTTTMIRSKSSTFISQQQQQQNQLSNKLQQQYKNKNKLLRLQRELLQRGDDSKYHHHDDQHYHDLHHHHDDDHHDDDEKEMLSRIELQIKIVDAVIVRLEELEKSIHRRELYFSKIKNDNKVKHQCYSIENDDTIMKVDDRYDGNDVDRYDDINYRLLRNNYYNNNTNHQNADGDNIIHHNDKNYNYNDVIDVTLSSQLPLTKNINEIIIKHDDCLISDTIIQQCVHEFERLDTIYVDNEHSDIDIIMEINK